MPFRERSIVSDREEFCRLALMPGANMRALCRGWSVSVTTGYKWRARYAAQGVAGVADRSRRPLASPARTGEEVEELVLAVRRAQGSQFEFNAKWPAQSPSSVFMFSSQNIDNMLRSFGTGLPIWTAYEVLILWCYANGWVRRCSRMRLPTRNRIRRKPDSHAPAISKGRVILSPIRAPMTRTGNMTPAFRMKFERHDRLPTRKSEAI